MRKRPPVADAHHDTDLTGWIDSRNDHYLFPRRHDQVTGLFDSLCEPMHDGQQERERLAACPHAGDAGLSQGAVPSAVRVDALRVRRKRIANTPSW